MKRLCIVDMNFTWPPDGGAPVELHWIATKFSSRFETTLVVPTINRWSNHVGQPWPLSKTNFFRRGRIASTFHPSYRIEHIPLTALASKPSAVGQAVSERIGLLEPDHVLVADGWYFKPQVMLALERYRPVLRLFSHEMLCLKGNGLLYRNGKVCEVDYLEPTGKDISTCVACAFGFYATYPSPRWIFEFVRSKAYKKSYWSDCRAAFDAARLVLVGNRFIQSRLSPHVSPPVRSVPNAVDVERFRASKRNAHRPFTILLLGRMDMPSKGFSFALRALDRCWEHRRDFEVLVATNRGVPRRPFFRRFTWIPHERVHEIYERADALLVPSLGPDVFPNVVLEAMASGLPVIGTSVGGIPDQIVDGTTGFVVSPGDVDSMSRTLLMLMQNREIAQTMGIRARQRAEDHFSIDGVFDAHYASLFS